MLMGWLHFPPVDRLASFNNCELMPLNDDNDDDDDMLREQVRNSYYHVDQHVLEGKHHFRKNSGTNYLAVH